MMSCKAAVKGNHVLTPEEARAPLSGSGIDDEPL